MGTEKTLTAVKPEETRCGSVAVAAGAASAEVGSGKTEEGGNVTMALIKCPECEHEVSDTAITCPNCGYTLKKEMTQQKRASFFEEHKKVIIGGLIILVIVIAGIIYSQNYTPASPFDKLKSGMTRAEVNDTLGEPSRRSDDYDADDYNGRYFMGLNGDLSVWYRSSQGEISHAFWDFYTSSIYFPDSSKGLETYENQTNKIIKYYTKLYGDPIIDTYSRVADIEYTWTDTYGSEISLRLERDSPVTDVDSITLYYNP